MFSIFSSDVQLSFGYMLGYELKNSTIGIVGYGNIGAALAKKLRGFEVREILYCGHNFNENAQEQGAHFSSFNDLCSNSDFIFICCPLTSETRNMFNAEVFTRMKKTSVLINIARGEIVNETDLYDALANQKIFAAGLDVTCSDPAPSPHHPLMNLPNCIILPHIASATVILNLGPLSDK